MADCGDKTSLLASLPFFEGMPREHLARLAPLAIAERFEPGSYLFHAGHTATRCYFVRDGHVAIEVFDAYRGPIVVQTLGEGGVVGWSWLVEPYRWCFDARAADLVSAVALDGAGLRELCEEDHEFGYVLLKRFTGVFAKRLQAARFHLLDVFGHLSTDSNRQA